MSRSFDHLFAGEQIEALNLSPPCHAAARCWLAAASADGYPTLAAFKAAAGQTWTDAIAVYAFDGDASIVVLEMGEQFLRALGYPALPADLRAFTPAAAHTERVRRCARVIAGAAMKTIRQVRRANGIGFTAEELTLPLAGEGPSGERLCFTFADFDPEALQFRAEAGNASYDTPAFAQFAELWRS